MTEQKQFFLKYSDPLHQYFVEAPLAAITVLSLLRYDTTEFKLILFIISEVQMLCPMFFLSFGYLKKNLVTGQSS
jgi:hypothetical protein